MRRGREADVGMFVGADGQVCKTLDRVNNHLADSDGRERIGHGSAGSNEYETHEQGRYSEHAACA